MKLKQTPDDFQVEELTAVALDTRGPYALYRMEKRGWSTPDAVQAVRRRWQLPPRRLSFGGLKDRHAQTVQYLTILHGPQRGLTHQGVRLVYLGQVADAYTSRHIQANRFRVTLRALSTTARDRAHQALAEVAQEGVPNYFDDQRFGSVVGDDEFVARLLLLGRFEDALRLALAGRYAHDRAEQKKEKVLLREHWGNWPVLKNRLARGHARSLVDYLAVHPGDYRGALARLRPELRGLYLSAYQSHLWNRMLARWLQERCPPGQLVLTQLRLGDVPMHRGLEPELFGRLADLRLPLPSARGAWDADDPRTALVDSILEDEGLRREELKLKGLRELYFSKGERAGLCLPAKLTWRSDPDERHGGRWKTLLDFELPPGSYATMLVKRVTAVRPVDGGGGAVAVPTT
jgi:tRNA pseudouridine13 synthase